MQVSKIEGRKILLVTIWRRDGRIRVGRSREEWREKFQRARMLHLVIGC